MTTVIVTRGDRELVYRIVDGTAGDERLVIEKVPERTLDQIRADEGSRPMTPEEFDRYFGHLPTDDEG